MHTSTFLSLFIGGVFAQNTAPLTVSLSPPTAAPADAFAVSQGFIAFGIEGRDFQDYTGNDSSPDTFSQNMFQSFTNRTGAPVNIRVGGTSMDNTIWDPDQQVAVNYTGNLTQMGLHTNITLGSSWVKSFGLIPNANWTIQVPLARRNPTSNVVAFANACINAVPGGLQRVEAIEIGNEPDLYPTTPQQPHTDRPSTYGPADYVKDWQTLGKALEAGIPGLNASQPRHQAGSLSSGATIRNPPWHMSDVFEAGINSSGMAKLAAQHYYQITSSGTLQGSLMNHSNTVTQMHNQFQSDISFMHANFTHIPYILGEVGSSLQAGGNLIIDQSLGDALWTVDFLLHAMTLGISRVNMQLGNFAFSAWESKTDAKNPTNVRGNFYGHVFVADFIGTQGNLSVAPLSSIPSSDHPNLVGYAAYNSGQLSKLALIDLTFWSGNSSSARPSQNVTIAVGTGVKQIKVERLASPEGADALQPNITWAGNLWTKQSNGLPQLMRNDTTFVQVSNGTAEGVNIEASEALLLTLVRG